MADLIDRDALGVSLFPLGKKDAADIYRLIMDAPAVNRWIPCSERLPEESGSYLVVYHPCFWDDVKWSKRCVGIDTFRGKTTWAKKKYQRVTHWMPLPEPPEV